MSQAHLRSGTPLMEKSTTLGTVTQINHRHRDIRDLLVPVHRFVQERVRKRSYEENDAHTRIPEDRIEFMPEDLTGLLELQPEMI